jgi:rhamnogalacturonan endolyase
MKNRLVPTAWVLALSACAAPASAQYVMERLGRGVVAVRTSSSQVYVGWRLHGNDPSGVGFNVYRTSGGTTVRQNAAPITATTNYVDTTANLGQANAYFVRPVVDGVEQAASAAVTLPANAPTRQYLEVPLQLPAGGSVVGSSYTYSTGDVSVGDMDGDGEYEYVVKWDPSNQHDNSQSGFTGPVLLDAYRLNGARLWRIDLGRNIRAGAHYTQFQVFDYDGDGRAEVAVKTGDGSVSGTGQVIGDAGADHRNGDGQIISGPEFLTVFDGQTGAVRATASFQPARGNVTDWGDNYGNRSERYLAGTAYLDGRAPSIVMGRGYYEQSKIAAWDFRNGALSLRWLFDSNVAGSLWEGRGAHSLSVTDVDGNGGQEVVYGGMTINSNGTGRYTTSYYAHGDALHVGDFVPSRPGKEIWLIHEQSSGNAASLRDASSGAFIMTKQNTCSCEGPARGVAGDVYAGNPGAEFWGAGTGLTSLFSSTGASVGRTPGSANFLVWWDADPVRELLDGNHVDKYGTSADTRLLTADGASSINGTKATPNLSADVLGDWREEVLLRSNDSRVLRIYTTVVPATNRFYTFMHDPQYRVEIARQNTAYNQPPHTSFFVGSGMAAPPTPNITFPGTPPGSPTYQAEAAVFGGGAATESTNGGFTGSGYVNFPATGGFLEFRNVDGATGGTRTLRFRVALGVTSTRTGRLVVNGAGQNITFNPTGAWTSWANVDVSVGLFAGTTNTIRLESNGQDLANIDQLQRP